MKYINTIKTILLIGSTFFICNMRINAQSGGVNSILQEQVPVSPNAAELGKYGQVPVGLFTGTVNYSIPIYNIKLRQVEIPITANYSSNGVNVDRYESNLGIDWSLNTGGVINRVLYDEPDESCRVSFPSPPYGINDVELMNITSSDCADIQLDIFTFNVNGYSGKFILDGNFQPEMIEPTPVKIEKAASYTYTNGIEDPEFIITTPDGTMFWFGGNNGSEYAFSKVDQIMGGGSVPPSDRYKTSWYISKIRTIDNQEVIYTYRSQNRIRDTGIMQSVKASYTTNYVAAQHEYPAVSKTYSTESFLENITWNEGEINFEGTDLITSIKVRNNHNVVTNQFDFSYLVASSNTTYQNPDCDYCGLNTTRNFLSEIRKVDPTGINNAQIHSFEYYDPNALPPRLTYARDHWGYFNGKNNLNLVSNDVSAFNPNDYSTGASQYFNYNHIQDLFGNLSGNKNADPAFGIKGLLKKITFPTDGYNELEYEAHSLYREIPQNTTDTKHLAVNTSSQFSNQSAITVTSPVLQEVILNSSVAFQTGSHPIHGDCIKSEYPSHWIRGTITVLDITTNQYISFYQKTQGVDLDLGTSYNLIGENSLPANSIYVILEENHQYSFNLSLAKPCLSMGLSFNYINQSQLVYANVPVGGMRIKTIKSYDGRGNIYTKDYKYGNDNCFECSSGVMETIKPAISFFESGSNSGGTYATFECRLGSNSLNSLYFSQGYHIAYPTVYEFSNNSSGEGYKKNLFDIVFDNIPVRVKGDWIVGTPYSNGFGNGNILLEQTFDANTNKLTETSYTYSLDNNFNTVFENFNVNRNYFVTMYSETMPNGISYTDFNVNKYFLYVKRKYLSSSVSKQYFYDSSNNLTGSVSTNTIYNYNNLNHLQLTSQLSSNSLGEAIETTYEYAHEKGNQALIDKNMIGIPLVVESYNGTEKVSEKETIYKDWGNGLLAPEIIKTSNGVALEERAKYTVVDPSNGNPLEMQQVGGTPVTYIWGYNKTQPIAKIENATYAQVQPYEANLQTLSNGTDEASLITALNNLRTSLPNAMITTYTYKPLVGISTITDAKGNKITYHYDSFNRLQFVKDQDENDLSKNDYHYKN